MSRPTGEEEALLARAASGDDAAFGQLTRLLLPRIRRWALARTGDPDEADEVVQETLIRMYRGLSGFAGAAALSSWIYRILANAANERDRAHSRRAAVADSARVSDPGPFIERPDPIGRLHAHRMAAVVREYLSKLPPRQREVLELVDNQGMRPIEVAEALDMNPVTVRANLLRARRALRSRILERHPELMEGYER